MGNSYGKKKYILYYRIISYILKTRYKKAIDLRKVLFMDLRSAWLTIIRNCNLKCSWCYAKDVSSKINNEMKVEIAKELIDISLSVGIKDFKLIGGEPTLHTGLFEILRYLIKNNCKIVIVTNGIILKNKQFCNQINELNYDKIYFGISLKGSSDEEYLQNCGSNAFASVIKGIRNCDEMGLNYSLSYVLTVDNVKYLDIFAKRIKDCNINKPITFSFCNDAISSDDKKYSCKQHPLVIDSIFAQKYPSVNFIFNNKLFLHQSLPLCMCNQELLKKMKEKNQVATSCHVHRRSGVIFDIDGSILLCNHLAGFSIGKFKQDYWDGKSFADFWESEYMIGLYKKFTSMPSLECMECSSSTECGGGCCIQWFFHDFESYKNYKRKENGL